MKRVLVLFIVLFVTINLNAQSTYDSISVSRCTIENNWYGPKWPDSLKLGRFKNYINDERTVWVKKAKPEKVVPDVIFLSNEIKSNGTEDVSKCFIPRHSINFYKNGKISRYLLVCFECDGVHFSDDPVKTFVKSLIAREKQMKKLKHVLKDVF